MSSFWSDNLPKLGQMFGAIAVFLAVLAGIFYIAGRANGKAQRPVAILVFLGPALLLLLFGLLGPAIRTFLLSFKGSASHSWVGFRNYQWLFTDETMRIVLRNTVFWILFTPIITTGLGLLLAILLDRMRRESVAKSLIFMPMAISFVGASIVWQFVYKYANPNQPQVGLMSSIARHLGFEPTNWLLTQPMNTFLLMIVFVWSQTGFAMVILSAAIKNVPADIMEASALDGATGWRLFRGVTFPMVRSTFIVVLATMVVATLKLFDIVRASTGGNFGTSVLANEMYSETFIRYDAGRGAAMAIVLFFLVMPVLSYNIYNLRRERTIA
jgi:alpha-glucoside transport system permease protein